MREIQNKCDQVEIFSVFQPKEMRAKGGHNSVQIHETIKT